MRDQDLYATILGVRTPLSITEVVLRAADEEVERSFANTLETGGLRHVHARRTLSVPKRALLQAAAVTSA